MPVNPSGRDTKEDTTAKYGFSIHANVCCGENGVCRFTCVPKNVRCGADFGLTNLLMTMLAAKQNGHLPSHVDHFIRHTGTWAYSILSRGSDSQRAIPTPRSLTVFSPFSKNISYQTPRRESWALRTFPSLLAFWKMNSRTAKRLSGSPTTLQTGGLPNGLRTKRRSEN